jgi:sugar/nucleoside kinase (ribokinase family)
VLPTQNRVGLFVGLITLDLVYLTDHAPANNQKLVATDYTLAAGGPATNAAVAFRALGSTATVLGALGCHPIAHLIRSDLQTCGVAIVDLAPNRSASPPVSSIVVTQDTGERAVVSINAVGAQAHPSDIPSDRLRSVNSSVDSVNIVLLDGHQMTVGRAIATQAKAVGIPVVIDGGSWKPEFETVLPLADYVICSANFLPPDCLTSTDVISYLSAQGIAHIAITYGDQPIVYHSDRQSGTIAVPAIHPIDTLAAGDIFHGAFCHFILHLEFVEALERAAAIAALSCQSFGPRCWLTELKVKSK